METPFFSVVVPTHSRPRQLERVLRALTRLNWPAEQCEITVVDDGSREQCSEIVAALEDQLNLRLIRQPNRGPAAARNTGGFSARGRFLVFTDDDCEPEPDWLHALAEAFRADPGAMLGGQTVNAFPANPYSTVSQLLVDYLTAWHRREKRPFFASNNLALPAESFRKIGGFDTSYRLAAGEDREFCRRWRENGLRMIHVPEAVVRHSHALTFTSFFRQQFQYGRGAAQFHRDAQPKRHGGPLPMPLSFYLDLFRCAPTSDGERGRWTRSFLVTFSQLAVASGFAWDRCQVRRQPAGAISPSQHDCDIVIQRPVNPAPKPQPHVSVVIPTYHRPRLVERAVRSALQQTLDSIEVIVVVDGLDEATFATLARIDDARMKIVRPQRTLGNAGARNAGVQQARGQWVAFLDDDDLWMPEKLAAQVQLAEESGIRFPVVTCRLIARNETTDFVWPRRLPRACQNLGEYLFCRNLPLTGDGLIQTSTVLTSTELARKLPFQDGLKKYVDQDWLLRADREEGVEILFASTAPLVVWHIEDGRARVTNNDDWRWALSWVRERRHIVTPRAYGAFVLTVASGCASRQRDWSAFFPLLREAYGYGRPNTVELVSHLANFAIPRRVQSGLAGLVGRKGQGTTR